MMAQSLTRVSASKESPGSYVQYTPDSSELFDRSQDPLTPEYIDVTEQGTISNASRLETLLKDRDSNQPKSSSSKKQNQSLTSKDTHFLFDTSMSNKERYSLFMKFDLPVGVRDKLVGALTALNILLENDKLIGTVITGEPFKSSYADIRINDNHHERKGILYNHMGKMPKDDVRVNSVSINSSSLDLGTQNMTAVASENTRTLPESIQEFVKSLVYLVLYPTLETWASRHYKGYPLDTLNEEKSMYIYEDLIQWICLFSRVSLDDDDDDDDYMSDSQEVMDEDVDLSSTDEDYSCSDDDMPMVSVHARPLRNYEEAESSTSAKRNTDDGSESDGDTQVYRAYPNPRKIESAAERLGETRRKGERFDLDDLPTMQKNNSYTSKYYTGFSNRALILLSSLTRYGKSRMKQK